VDGPENDGTSPMPQRWVELRGLEPLTLCMPCGNSRRAFVQVKLQIDG
jgi:hypothetical protein